MLNEPCWITPEGLIQLNLLATQETGEPHQLLDRNLLDGACARPKNHWHYNGVDDVVILGCLLLLAVARNHPFLQGNKRTAFAAMIGFWGANGYELTIADHTPNADYLVSAIEGKMTDDEFIDAMRPCVHRV